MLNIISFTETGRKLNREICERLGEKEACGYSISRFAEGLQELPEDREQWIGCKWGKENFLFIGATGIAIRMIAPFVRDKFTDSAVLSMDERGQFVIPLLSGHLGGAVELAEMIASKTGAIPVITTATDIQKKFAVDVFAKTFRYNISDRQIAKEISAAVLEDEKIGVYVGHTRENVFEELEKWGQLIICKSVKELEKYRYKIVIESDISPEACLRLIPQKIVLGIGCRKGISTEVLREGIQNTLDNLNISSDQIVAITSIDLKKEEAGILEIAKELQVPFICYSAKELQTIERVSSSSEFVAQVTGVDNVCERAAQYYMNIRETGYLIQKKTCLNGMTIAVGVLET